MKHKSAWVFQCDKEIQRLGKKFAKNKDDPKEVERVGRKRAAHCVGWREPDGSRRRQSCGTGEDGRKAAFRVQKRIEAELVTGTYEPEVIITWEQFINEIEGRDDEDQVDDDAEDDAKAGGGEEPDDEKKGIYATMSDENVRIYKNAIAHFERLVSPVLIGNIGVKQIDTYIAKRSKENGRVKGSKVSPATINKELRHIKAILNYAVEWGYLAKIPNFKKRWLREPEKIPVFVTEEDFERIYNSCTVATKPVLPNTSATDWWRALLTMAYMTGWRIDELISLKREDLDLERGTAITRHTDNKAKKDSIVYLHEIVVDHLRSLPGFEENVFHWPHPRRQQWNEFHIIQDAAEIHVPCTENHEHNEVCHHYGFHDFRRAFATENAEALSTDELRGLMRHQSYATTQKYINMARQLRADVSKKLKVPGNLQKKTS